jgi:NAD(P)-dependent dehydrogenase (short-subunit alcohol dehydrogenase family)
VWRLAMGITHMLDLKSRVAIVTGAGRGLGRGIARRLARAGATVTVADINGDTAATTCEEIRRDFGVSCAYRKTDVGDQADAVALVDDTFRENGRIDILINAAQGFTPLKRIEDKTNDMFEYSLRTGLYASLWTMQAVLPHMKQRKDGRIINFCSLNGIVGELMFSDYNATKEAIRGLTKSAAREWGPFGIRVNCIAPAGLSPAHMAYEKANPEFAKKLRKAIALGYVGDPEEDIGGVALCLCSDEGRFITGMTIFADGGLHLSPLPALDAITSEETAFTFNPAHPHAPNQIREA